MNEFLGQFLGFIGINLIIFLSSTLLTIWFQKFRIRSWMKTMFSVAVLYYSLITLSSLFFGSIGQLHYANMVIFHIVTFLILASTIGYKLVKEWRHIDISKKMKPVDWFIFSALFSPFVILAFTRFFNAVFQVPIEYDNLAYHLPFVVSWFKTGNLWDIYYSAYAGPLGYYPSNFELIDLWHIMPFHSDLMVNLLNLPLFCLLPFLLYAVARNFNIAKYPSFLVVALFLMMPVTLRQMGVPLVDLYFTITFLFGIYFLQEFRKSKSLFDITLAGLALGLFMGTKYLGVVYIVPLVLAFIVYIFITHLTQVKKLFAAIGILGLTIMLTGSFWYIRNWVDTGNPLFPTDVTIAGTQVFEGYTGITDNLVETSLVSNIPSEKTFQFFLERFFLMVGPQMYFFLPAFAFMIVIIFVKLGEAIFRKEKAIKRSKLLHFIAYTLLIAAILVYSSLYWLSPYSFKDLIPNVRYAFIFLLFSSLTLGVVMTELRLMQPVFYFASFAFIIFNFVYLVLFPPLSILTNERLVLDFYQLADNVPYALLLVFILSAIFAFFYFLKHIFKEKKYIVISILLLLNITVLSFIFFHSTKQVREENREALYIGWYNKNLEWLHLLKAAEWVNDNDPTAPIAYTGFNFHYPLYGRNLERDVDYVNVNSCLDCKYVDFKDNKQSIRADANYDDWYNNLSVFKKKYVVLKNLGDKSFELDWMVSRPDKFEEVFHEGDVYIFKILEKS